MSVQGSSKAALPQAGSGLIWLGSSSLRALLRTLPRTAVRRRVLASQRGFGQSSSGRAENEKGQRLKTQGDRDVPDGKHNKTWTPSEYLCVCLLSIYLSIYLYTYIMSSTWQILDALRPFPPPTLTGDAAAHVAERWASHGLHALAQLPAKCASAAAHAAHVNCDLPALLAAAGPSGWRRPRLCREYDYGRTPPPSTPPSRRDASQHQQRASAAAVAVVPYLIRRWALRGYQDSTFGGITAVAARGAAWPSGRGLTGTARPTPCLSHGSAAARQRGSQAARVPGYYLGLRIYHRSALASIAALSDAFARPAAGRQALRRRRAFSSSRRRCCSAAAAASSSPDPDGLARARRCRLRASSAPQGGRARSRTELAAVAGSDERGTWGGCAGPPPGRPRVRRRIHVYGQ